MKITKKQKELKARFHRLIKDNPLVDTASISNEDIRRLVGDSGMEWLSDPDIRAWFVDSKLLDDLLVMGAEEAVARLIEIVSTRDVGPREAVTSTAQVSAAKLLMEFAGMKPATKVEKTVTSGDLSDDPEELREYIKKNINKLESVK
jgi:hypothetical protein